MGTQHFTSWGLIQQGFLLLHWNQPCLAAPALFSIDHLSCVQDCPVHWAGEHRWAEQSFFRQVLFLSLISPSAQLTVLGTQTACLAWVRGRWQRTSPGTSQLKSSVILAALKYEKCIKITCEPVGFPLIKSRADFQIIKSKKSIKESELASGGACIASGWWGRQGQGTLCSCVSEVTTPG